MTDFLNSKKRIITQTIESYIKKALDDELIGNMQYRDVFMELLDFSTRGKMVRGSLVYLGYNLFAKDNPVSLAYTAAAMEMFQSALLIHDDIMDLDKTRRGRTTVYQKFVKESEEKKRINPDHTGISLGICAGDLAFFTAYDLLSQIDIPAGQSCLIHSLFAREMTIVGLAQMNDVSWGSEKSLIKKSSIIDLYRKKTGRYTFSLPLKAGAILAEASEIIQEKLVEIGENIGILFQIKDDELGIFGNIETTGKPVGSDIKERKKTFHFLTLLENCTKDEREKLLRIYKQDKISEKDTQWVLDLMEKNKIKKIVEEKTNIYYKKTIKLIDEISGEYPDKKKMLESILVFNSKREK